MEEIKKMLAELTGRVAGLEAEVNALRVENESLKRKLEYTTLLAKAAHTNDESIVPNQGGLIAYTELLKLNGLGESSDRILRYHGLKK